MHDDALSALPWKTVEKRNKRRSPSCIQSNLGPQAGVAETLKTGPTSDETGPQRQTTPRMGLEPQTITGKVPSRH